MSHAVIEARFDVPLIGMQAEFTERTCQKDDEAGASHNGGSHQGKPVKAPVFILCKEPAHKGEDVFAEKNEQAEQNRAGQDSKKALSDLQGTQGGRSLDGCTVYFGAVKEKPAVRILRSDSQFFSVYG